MKKLALVFVGLSFVLVVAAAGHATSSSQSLSFSRTAKVTVEQARKIALQKVAGEVEDEWSLDDDDDDVVDAYIFIIKDKNGKTFEIQIAASNGEVLSVEDISDAEDNDNPPVSRK